MNRNPDVEAWLDQAGPLEATMRRARDIILGRRRFVADAGQRTMPRAAMESSRSTLAPRTP